MAAAKKKSSAPRKKAASKARPSADRPAVRPAVPNIFIFAGNDEGRVRQAALECYHKLAEKVGEFGAESFDGTVERAEDASRVVGNVIEALQTLPFFGGGKVVWLKNANFFGDTVTSAAEATVSAQEALAALLTGGLPPDVNFILSANSLHKGRRFYKRVSEVCEVRFFEKPDTAREGWEEEVIPQVLEQARRRGLSFAHQAAEFFVMLLGTETQNIETELEKLALYVHPRKEIQEEDVRQVVSMSRGGVIWEIGNAISRRQLPRALDMIDHLLKRGETAIGILLGAIVPQVRRLLQAKELIERFGLRAGNYRAFEAAVARLPAEEIEHIPKKKEGGPNVYPLFLASQEASRFRLEELCSGLEACLEANVRLVRTSLDARVVLNQLVIRLLAK